MTLLSPVEEKVQPQQGSKKKMPSPQQGSKKIKHFKVLKNKPSVKTERLQGCIWKLCKYGKYLEERKERKKALWAARPSCWSVTLRAPIRKMRHIDLECHGSPHVTSYSRITKLGVRGGNWQCPDPFFPLAIKLTATPQQVVFGGLLKPSRLSKPSGSPAI